MNNRHFIRTPNTTCAICNTAIYRRPSQLKRYESSYCSQACYGKSCQKPVPCVICGTEILGSKNAKTCSRACSNKHRTGIKYKGGNNGSFRPVKDKVSSAKAVRRRLIEARGSEQCEECGYNNIPEVVQVHHIIERCDGGSDELNNLQLLCPNCHYEEHHRRKEEKRLSKSAGVA